MSTIVNGATKARLVWILAQLQALADNGWIRPEGETVLAGARIELQDVVAGATEPVTVAPATEIIAMTSDQVTQLIDSVSSTIGAARTDILGQLTVVQSAITAAPAPTSAPTAAPAPAPAPAA